MTDEPRTTELAALFPPEHWTDGEKSAYVIGLEHGRRSRPAVRDGLRERIEALLSSSMPDAWDYAVNAALDVLDGTPWETALDKGAALADKGSREAELRKTYDAIRDADPETAALRAALADKGSREVTMRDETALRDALNDVVGKMTWRSDGTAILHDAEAWRTLVGRIVMATNGDNDGQVPMGAAPRPAIQDGLREALDETIRPYLRAAGLGVGTMDAAIDGICARLSVYWGVTRLVADKGSRETCGWDTRRGDGPLGGPCVLPPLHDGPHSADKGSREAGE